MRKAPGKELGYIILPVVVPTGIAPEEALKNNDRYKVVWQVLQALRSHDDRFHALVNKLELNKKKPTNKLDIISITTPIDQDKDASSTEKEQSRQDSVQAVLEFPTDQFRDAMYARIVQKVGERRYWETWARDVADIAAAHVTRIRGLLADPESDAAREFDVFLTGLRGNLNDNVTADEAIDMLAQHLVTRPIFEALFDGYDFAATNPVAKTMELMLASLDEHNLASENETLQTFYDSVRRRVAGVDNAEGKQRILVELYDKFFAVAFKKTVDRLGIVYTPVEIVDFILRSADAVMRQEFGQGLTDAGVHILDGFTGTGTFLVRLLQSGLIEPHDLARKYAEELHGNEILLLAYYIAAVNIEQTYADLAGREEPFPGLILTDTFQSWEPEDRPDLNIFPENNERLETLKQLPITVVVGNPPYSVGQDSANDDMANDKYPALDEAIRQTYAARASKSSIRGLYDSYVRAIKWASLRVGERGVVAYVTNGGFLTASSADGLRKSLVEEFAAVHVFNLRGNRRNAGAEGRPIFEAYAKGGGGSIAGITIVVLVKDERRSTPAIVRYAQVGDFTTAHEKIAEVVAAGSVLGTASTVVVPDDHGDWLGQRRADFAAWMPLSEADTTSIFTLTSKGLTTNRDMWVYGSSRAGVLANVRRLAETYNDALGDGLAPASAPKDPRRIAWSRRLLNRYSKGELIAVEPGDVRIAQYRPFSKSFAYFNSSLNEDRRRIPWLFPKPSLGNLGFLLTGVSSHYDFGVVAADSIPDLHLLDTGQFFGRWRYERVGDEGMLDLGDDDDVVDGYRRIDNITDEALAKFGASYEGETVTKDDVFFYVYGLLHSPEYRDNYAADLKKMLPRIPLVREFRAFADAGRALSQLHLKYESVEPYDLAGLDVQGPSGDAAYDFFSVGSKKMAFGKASAEQKLAGERYDRSVIHYNDRITLSGIPEEAYRYMLGSRSAIEWVIDRYYVKTDRASGIVNDPNDWSREVGDSRYIIELLARIVTVSVETIRIVDHLPPLDIIEETT